MNASGVTSLVSLILLIVLVLALLATHKWIDEDVFETHRLRIKQLVADKLKEARALFDQTDRFNVASDPVENLAHLTKAHLILRDVTAMSVQDDVSLSKICGYDVKFMRAELQLRFEIAKKFMREKILEQCSS